ncbi:MAG TPA: deoxyguanosinetriphosphate triphosphohydrolase, partial [Xanthobacteraceae bacterium]|nr:deoxyguanosinetriphosphate triphosphohydrolase [Xanthobacteraceae bacterium]
PRVLGTMSSAQQALHDLFSYYFDHLDALPPGWTEHLPPHDDFAKARRIADFIAGMTDNFALEEHRRFFDSRLDLR